jgi:hypothetical protein
MMAGRGMPFEPPQSGMIVKLVAHAPLTHLGERFEPRMLSEKRHWNRLSPPQAASWPPTNASWRAISPENALGYA